MPRGDWSTAIGSVVRSLQSKFPVNVRATEMDFSIDGNRYEIKKSCLHIYTKIFPQFSLPGEEKDLRFRQALTPSTGTIEDVLEAVNFFLVKIGKYSEDEIRFLISYYNKMEVPALSDCLTTILAVYHAFKREFESSRMRSLSETILAQGRKISNINKRVIELEQQHQLEEMKMEEQANEGGDRACYFPIRPCDRSTRKDWCFPGRVFGLYSDGVGKLYPIKTAIYRRSVVVYSACPDTLEAHPDPEHPELYVPVVMVSLPSLYSVCSSPLSLDLPLDR
jgi:hypothetical protein